MPFLITYRGVISGDQLKIVADVLLIAVPLFGDSARMRQIG
jgi:hypothetical protein